ncbi:hypothetical protein [Limnohabitans sp.]|uniref:hypothetical protein n=1 Tax=Limnohabitans sp. TaxID=1907725 RepID=UPI00286F6AD5|nr:hypothetical protein [Limnohabitans sp.]
MTKTLTQYEVQADPITGEWMTDPMRVGEVTASQWHAKTDTENSHFDTFELDGITCAIEVKWAD